MFCRIENDLVLEPSLFHPGIHMSMDNYLVSTSNKTVHFIITKSIILQFFFQHCFSASDKVFEEPPSCQMASGKFESKLIPTLVANDWVFVRNEVFSISLIILFGQPLLAIILQKLLINEVEFGCGTKSNKIALVETHVNPCFVHFIIIFLTKNLHK